MIKLMFWLLMISIISLEVTVVMLLIREKQQDKEIEKLGECLNILERNYINENARMQKEHMPQPNCDE